MFPIPWEELPIGQRFQHLIIQPHGVSPFLRAVAAHTWVNDMAVCVEFADRMQELYWNCIGPGHLHASVELPNVPDMKTTAIQALYTMAPLCFVVRSTVEGNKLRLDVERNPVDLSIVFGPRVVFLE